MDIFQKTKNILIDILDVEENEINEETYLIRDLDAESIDLLEIAVTLNSKFNKEIIDEQIFLKNFRLYLDEAKEKKIDTKEYLSKKYNFLPAKRIVEIIDDIKNGPALKVKDLIYYIERK